MYLLSALGGGLFVIPLGLLLASIFSFYKGVKQWKSGSTWDEDLGMGKLVKHESDERVGFFSVGANVFGAILLVAAIVSFVIMLGDK